ncbi:MAG TPA: DJ-1/PfpI family protein [Vicinamibacterales bacterium]|jgi:transcriptional regulator GlxA family with amidase domain|nr:DJ-1/PfpI family protein [Vicinamibacterales bacterium]
MTRRELLKRAAAAGLWITGPGASVPGRAGHAAEPDSIPVAFVVSDGAVVIDFSGPWEVFQDVTIAGQANPPFSLYTVAESTAPIRATGGMRITPDYTFSNAPMAKVIVIPAQRGVTESMLQWIRNAAKTADLTMSVCVGADVLARTGLLSGKPATTHHSSYRTMALQYPEIDVKRGVRFVDDGTVASSGGLSSGIDLALHVVERYYGRDVAAKTAYYMEYQGEGWRNPGSNEIYAAPQTSTADHPLCPVCGMDVDPKTGLHAEYRGQTYYFCRQEHKTMFDASPETFVK